MAARALLGFDVGNSCVKVGILGPSGLMDPLLVPHAHQERLRDGVVERIALVHTLLETIPAGKDPSAPRVVAAISTVNPPASENLRLLLEELHCDVAVELRSDGRLFREGYLGHRLQTPQTTGVDRVLSAIAALARSPGRSVIVVDAGSAVTVNLTTADRVFQGGAILPGFRLMGRGLHKGTAALPSVTVLEPPDARGDSTERAIAAGVYFAVLGGVERIVGELSRLPQVGGQAPEVFLAGGDAELLRQRWATPHTLAPHLVMEGLAIVLERMGIVERAERT